MTHVQFGAHRPEWLALTQEIAEEPELPIIDCHHHLWDHPGEHYLLPEFVADVATGHDIRATVFVECRESFRRDGPEAMRPVGETDAVDAIARNHAADPTQRTRVAEGIVGHVDFNLGDAVAPVLEAHVAASPTRFRGIRQLCTWDDSPAMQITGPRASRGMMLDATFRKGFRHLRTLGLSYDAWQFHTQLAELALLARAFPDVSIIVNHAGGPIGVGPYAGKREEVMAYWKRGLAEVAACPNTVIKLGGMGMPRAGLNLYDRARPPTSAELAEATAPYYLTCIELFGPDRCMFEANFPVDKQSYSYCVVWNSFKRMTRGFSSAERAALFHDNAARVYRLQSA